MIDRVISELKSNELVPYIGIEIFKGAINSNGVKLPYDNDSLILAMNNNRPMSQRLMFEASRAAMHLEQKRGRRYIEEMFKIIYYSPFEPLRVHNILNKISPQYIIDTNRDITMQKLYSDRDHTLIVGVARITAENERFEIFDFDSKEQKYREIKQDDIDFTIPIIFKPMGSFEPNQNLIISDADYVDWLTEAMGGFAIPKPIKEYRKNKKYLFLGISFARDTERMVANEMSLDLDGGYTLLTKEPTKKELKFIEKHNLEVIDESLDSFLERVEDVL